LRLILKVILVEQPLEKIPIIASDNEFFSGYHSL